MPKAYFSPAKEGGFGTVSGPSRGGRCRAAIRPIALPVGRQALPALPAGTLFGARQIGVAPERASSALRVSRPPLVQPKPSCVGYPPPPPGRSVMITPVFHEFAGLAIDAAESWSGCQSGLPPWTKSRESKPSESDEHHDPGRRLRRRGDGVEGSGKAVTVERKRGPYNHDRAWKTRNAAAEKAAKTCRDGANPMVTSGAVTVTCQGWSRPA